MDNFEEAFKVPFKTPNLVFDLGNLYTYDPKMITLNDIKNLEIYLKDLTAKNAEDLLSRLNKLPTERQEEVLVIKLPDPEIKLPREKKIPIQKPLTKWEKFAKEKGIKNMKKERMVFDEGTQSWKPVWGYERADGERTKNWLIELPDNRNPYDDAFAVRKDKLVAAKAKIQRAQIRNVKRAKLATGMDDSSNKLLNNSFATDKKNLNKSLRDAHISTASLGKFPYKAPANSITGNNNNMKGGIGSSGKFKLTNAITAAVNKPKKSPVLLVKHEKQSQLDLLKTLANKEPKLQNLDKLANEALNNLVKRDREATRDAKSDTVRSKTKLREMVKAKKYNKGTTGSHNYLHKGSKHSSMKQGKQAKRSDKRKSKIKKNK